MKNPSKKQISGGLYVEPKGWTIYCLIILKILRIDNDKFNLKQMNCCKFTRIASNFFDFSLTITK